MNPCALCEAERDRFVLGLEHAAFMAGTYAQVVKNSGAAFAQGAEIGAQDLARAIREEADRRRGGQHKMHEAIGSYLIGWAKTLVVVTDPCNLPLECGSTCWLQRGHSGECCCVSDDEGPGTCPA